MAVPKISVAMSVYNNAPHLEAAIESILAQTEGDFEFLILNDGSTDGSGDIIDRFALRDRRVRPIHQQNKGLVFSLNRLLREARSPLIARMDGDDISLPTRFEKQVEFLSEHPDHGVVGTWATCIDEAGAVRGNCGEKPLTHEQIVASLEQGPLLCHPSVIMRREVVIGAGGYRAAYRHCEDYDLWLRLSGRTRLGNLAERLILYRHSDSQVSSRHMVEQQVNTAIAFEAHCEREAGRGDPTEGLDTLPPIDALDQLFERPGIGRQIRAQVVRNMLYSPAALRGDAFELLLRHAGEGGAGGDLWRTAARLVRIGEPKRALRLVGALAAG